MNKTSPKSTTEKTKEKNQEEYIEVPLPKLPQMSAGANGLNPTSIFLVILLVAFAYLLGVTTTKLQDSGKNVLGAASNPAPTTSVALGQSAVPTLPPKQNVDNGHFPVQGKSNAPVKIVEFADFQCPFCGQFFKDTEPQIMKDYVNTGKATFAFRHYVFLDEKNYDPNSTDAESTWAAEASECANEQGKFWDYHDYLYSHQGQENSGAFSKANLEGFAGQINGINTDQFTNCLETDKYASQVAADTAAAKKFGVSATPTVFVNGQAVVGALPYDQFKAVIDQELKK